MLPRSYRIFRYQVGFTLQRTQRAKKRAYALILAATGVFGLVVDSQELKVAGATRPPSELNPFAN